MAPYATTLYATATQNPGINLEDIKHEYEKGRQFTGL